MKTSRFRIICLLIVLFSGGVYGQKNSAKGENTVSGKKQSTNLKKFINNLRPAFLNRDYETLATRMFNAGEFESPEEALDEERKARGIAVIKQLLEETAAEGMTFVVRLKSPQKIVAVGKKSFAVVPQNTTITVADGNRLKQPNGKTIKPGKYIAKGFILAISADQGNTWKFWSAFSEASFKNLFPETAGKIKFPRIQTPSFLIGR